VGRSEPIDAFARDPRNRGVLYRRMRKLSGVGSIQHRLTAIAEANSLKDWLKSWLKELRSHQYERELVVGAEKTTPTQRVWEEGIDTILKLDRAVLPPATASTRFCGTCRRECQPARWHSGLKHQSVTGRALHSPGQKHIAVGANLLKTWSGRRDSNQCIQLGNSPWLTATTGNENDRRWR
jgi:hypothetical protein